MLRRNWNWKKQQAFLSHFLSLVRFQFGGRPAWLSLCSNCGKQKKVFANFPRGFWRFPTKFQWFKKIVLSSSRGQGNFRGPKASRPRAKDLRLRGQGQGLENVSSRTSLEAKDVLKDSTSDSNLIFYNFTQRISNGTYNIILYVTGHTFKHFRQIKVSLQLRIQLSCIN